MSNVKNREEQLLYFFEQFYHISQYKSGSYNYVYITYGDYLKYFQGCSIEMTDHNGQISTKKNSDVVKLICKGKEYYFKNDNYANALYDAYKGFKRSITNKGNGKDDKEMDLFFQSACEYLKNSFDDKTYTYNNSFFGKIFNALEMLGITYSELNSTEMSKCLEIVYKQQKNIFESNSAAEYKEALQDDLNDWIAWLDANSSYTSLNNNDIYKTLYKYYNQMLDILNNVLNKTSSFKELEEAVVIVKKEIERVAIALRQPENIIYKYNDYFNVIPDNFLPHNCIKAFINEFIVPHSLLLQQYSLKQIDTFNDWNSIEDKLYELGFSSLTIVSFYKWLIEDLKKLIEVLKENEKFFAAKSVVESHTDAVITNEYFNLLNFFVMHVNNTLLISKNDKYIRERKII